MDLAKFKKTLKEFIAIKSISTDASYKEDMNKAADWLIAYLVKIGFKTKLLKGKTTNPVVFAEYKVNDTKAKTILLYGHYDIQVVGNDTSEWKANPFTLLEEKGRLYGRGVADDKGQLLIHLSTIAELIAQNKLAYNIKTIIEGNEETGNPDLAQLVEKNKKLLQADYIIMSDGEQTAGRPALDVSLRGGFNFTIKYKTANGNVHSGIYGAAIPNAGQELAILVSKMFVNGNQVSFADFYAGEDQPTKAEIKNNKSIGFEMLDLTKQIGVQKLLTEKNTDFFTQTGLRPCINLTGFKTGYIDDGYNNIIPGTAEAKFNVRLVTKQNPKKIFASIKKFVTKNTPKYVEYKIEVADMFDAIKLDTSDPKFLETEKLMTEMYRQIPVRKFVGGSSPIVMDFRKILGKDIISISLANEDCNMHGTNENFKIELIEKGIEFCRKFYKR